ncbi:hypothetical protein EJ03DRAFT_332145, partial [Teratosphaeria nubilosa]
MKLVTLLATLYAPLAIASTCVVKSGGNGICRPNKEEYKQGFRDQECAPIHPCKVDQNGCKFSRTSVQVTPEVFERRANC